MEGQKDGSDLASFTGKTGELNDGHIKSHKHTGILWAHTGAIVAVQC